MIIYHSSKVRPYVYIGRHRITNKIYIGYRKANTLPSDIDLYIYRTSSKVVHPIFNEFEWCILAEFERWQDAYDFEQQLIFEHWGSPLLLNGTYNAGGITRFAGVDHHSEKTKQVLADKATGRKQSAITVEKRVSKLRGKESKLKGKSTQTAESRLKIGAAQTAILANMSAEEKAERAKRSCSSPRSWTDERRNKISKALTGKVVSDETRKKMSKKCIFVSPSLEEFRFDGLKIGCDALGLHYGSVKNCLSTTGIYKKWSIRYE